MYARLSSLRQSPVRVVAPAPYRRARDAANDAVVDIITRVSSRNSGRSVPSSPRLVSCAECAFDATCDAEARFHRWACAALSRAHDARALAIKALCRAVADDGVSAACVLRVVHAWRLSPVDEYCALVALDDATKRAVDDEMRRYLDATSIAVDARTARVTIDATPCDDDDVASALAAPYDTSSLARAVDGGDTPRSSPRLDATDVRLLNARARAQRSFRAMAGYDHITLS